MTKEIYKKNGTNNIKNHKFFLFTKIPITRTWWFKSYLSYADSDFDIMHCIKQASDTSIMAMLDLTDKPEGDKNCDELILFYKENYCENYYNIYYDDIISYYAIRKIANSYAPDSQYCAFDYALNKAIRIYEKHFGDFYIFNSFSTFSKHISERYKCCKDFDSKAFDALCKSDMVDESKFMQLTFQGISRPVPTKTLCF